jgi:hypothetical protein
LEEPRDPCQPQQGEVHERLVAKHAMSFVIWGGGYMYVIWGGGYLSVDDTGAT